jgi:hypothetical protein
MRAGIHFDPDDLLREAIEKSPNFWQKAEGRTFVAFEGI